MTRLLVGISVGIDPELLAKINENIKGKTQSEKIRKCVEEGYVRLLEIENVRIAFHCGEKT
jgi:hypothetical protein